MRGGYRPGSGPRKGTKYRARSTKKTESEFTPKEKENIRLMLSFGKRLMDGGTLTRTETKQLEEIGESLGPLTRAEMILRDAILESLK